MPDARAFGSVLVRFRREQGFETAYAFYRSREGRRLLRLSFVNYLALEKGRSLPKPWRMTRLIQALGLPPGSREAGELARAYLACLAGEELVRLAGAADAGRMETADVSLGEAAAKQALSQRTAHLSMPQWKTLASDRAAYLCHVFLVNTPGWTPVRELGRVIGLSPTALRKALKSLAGARIVAVAGGRARSLYAKKFLAGLPLLPETSGLRSAQQEFRRGLVEERGKLAHSTQMSVRMPRESLERYSEHLRKAVHLGAVYGDVERGPDTAIYLVEGRVFEVFP